MDTPDQFLIRLRQWTAARRPLLTSLAVLGILLTVLIVVSLLRG